MRIAKFISRSGICSRRKAEELIQRKKVYINNSVCNKPNIDVNENDIIKINGRLIKINNKIRLWKLYKPIKVICTNYDPKKRRTLFDLIPKHYPRMISIGRLDYMSEGLILLTNNGDFARKLELPSSNILRKYKVYVSTKVKGVDISRINNGISIDRIIYNKVKVKIEKTLKDKSFLIFELKEGKNREIRNICKYFKWPIVKIIRLQYGSIKLSIDVVNIVAELLRLEI